METKRRLPVLKAQTDSDPQEERPPWQWVGFGALGIFVVWLPLAYLAELVVVRLGGLDQAPLARAGIFAASLAAASLAGGYLVGRWGTRGVGLREAALAGLAAAIIATALAWGAVGFSAGALVTVALATPPAALGGWLGLKKRAAA